jgi:Carboxypeptidase regulatory-like domain
MIRLKRALYFLIAFLFVAGCVGCGRDWTGDVHGVLTDEETEEPISGVIVTARSMKNDYSISTQSDLEGKYRIRDARWGPNEIKTFHPNYNSITRYADVIRDKSMEMDFELDRIPDSEDPIVTIRVINVFDSPIPGARIDLYERESREYDWYTYTDAKETDDDGYAQFFLNAISEDQVKFYRLKIVVQGYESRDYDFSLTWLNPFPTFHVVMNFAS